MTDAQIVAVQEEHQKQLDKYGRSIQTVCVLNIVIIALLFWRTSK